MPANVFVLSGRDTGGCMEALCREQRRRGWTNLRGAVVDPHEKAGFDHDLGALHDGGAELDELLASADVLHLVDLDPSRDELLGVPLSDILGMHAVLDVVVQLTRRPDWAFTPRELTSWAGDQRSRGHRLVANEPRLARDLAATFIPPFVPWWRSRYGPLLPGSRSRESLGRPTTVFASCLDGFDRRPALEAFVDRIESEVTGDWIMESVHGIDHAAVLGRRRLAHLTLTEHPEALALSALESLAQAVPVAADLPVDAAEAYRRLAGGRPVPIISEAQTPAAIAEIEARRDPDLSLAHWARAVLDPRRWFDLCDRLWVPSHATKSAARGRL